MKHSATYQTTNYPSSSLAYKITWTCSCGKSGGITDGRMGATYKRARNSFKQHAAKAVN